MPDFLRLRAEYFLDEKKYDDALADADRALSSKPITPPTELRGMILLGLERYDDALESFNKASELVPENARPYQYRAELYRQKGDLDKAIEQLTKALEMSPKNVAPVGAGRHVLRAEKAGPCVGRHRSGDSREPIAVEPYRCGPRFSPPPTASTRPSPSSSG